MFAMSRLRLPIVVIVGFVLAVLLAFAAFTSAEAAEQKDAAAKEPTDAAATEETDAATTEGTVPQGSKGPITIENHSWDDYHWARNIAEFTLNLGNNLTPNWKPYLETTSSDQQNIGWDFSSKLNTEIVGGGVTGQKGDTAKKCAATRGRVEVCNESYGQNGWLGIASIWINGDNHITQGATKLNDSYFNQARYNTPGWRNLVMCQEVGHTFGLAHQDEHFGDTNLGSCMDYTNDPDGDDGTNGTKSNWYPNTHDYEQLESIYGHNDSGPSTVGSTSGTSARDNIPGDGPRAWGKEIFRSADGRASIFEQDIGNRQKKVTHVLWTEERAKEHRGD